MIKEKWISSCMILAMLSIESKKELDIVMWTNATNNAMHMAFGYDLAREVLGKKQQMKKYFENLMQPSDDAIDFFGWLVEIKETC